MYKRVNYYDLCRLCSTSEGQKTSALPFSNTIETCLSITITDKDVLPSVICSSCEEKLSALNEFRESSMASQALLKSFFETNTGSIDFIQSGMVYVKSNSTETLTQEQGSMHVNEVNLPAVEYIQPAQQFEPNAGGQTQVLFTYQQPYQEQSVQEYITPNVYNQQSIQQCNQNQPILLSSNNLYIDINPSDERRNIITVLTMPPSNVQAVGVDTSTLTPQYQNIGNDIAITPACIENVSGYNGITATPQFEQYQMPIQSNVTISSNNDNMLCYNMSIPTTPTSFQQNLDFDQTIQNPMNNIHQITMDNNNIQQIPMQITLPVINISTITNDHNEPVFLEMSESQQLPQTLPVNNVDNSNNLVNMDTVERS